MKKPIKRLKISKRKTSDAISRTQSRYRFKPGFAEKLKERSQKQYRSARGSDFELTGNVVLRALDSLDDFAVPTAVTNSKVKDASLALAVRPVIIQTKLASILDKPYQTIWRWITETDQLPKPILIDNTEGRGRGVYHVDEVRVMVSVLGEHLLSYKYYRKDHAATRDRLFNEIEALRTNNYGETPNGKTNSQGKSTRKKITGRRSRG